MTRLTNQYIPAIFLSLPQRHRPPLVLELHLNIAVPNFYMGTWDLNWGSCT